MGVQIFGATDPGVEAFANALRPYAADHPAAEVDVYRFSPVSVRVRVTDPGFSGKSRSERHKAVWPILYQLDQDALGELAMLSLLAPEERETSPVSREFDAGRFAKAYGKALKTAQIGSGPPA